MDRSWWALSCTTGSLFALAAGAALAAAAPVAPQTVAELQEMMRGGRCPEVLQRVADLRRGAPQDVELMVLEANCRLNASRKIERVFQADDYERARIARGGGMMPPEAAESFYRVETRFDPAEQERALGLLAEALRRAPGRADLLVGNVAALAYAGRAQDAAALLRKDGARLAPGALADAAATVQDLLTMRRTEDAALLANALREVAPSEAFSQRAVAAVALARQDVRAALEALQPLIGDTTDEVATRQLAQLLMLGRRWNEAQALLAAVAGRDLQMTAWLALVRGRLVPRSAVPLWKDIQELMKVKKLQDPTVERLIAHYLRAFSGEKLPTPMMRVRASRMFQDAGMTLPAIVEADAAAAEDPALAEAHAMLAEIYRTTGRFDLALEVLDQQRQVAAGAAEGEAARRLAEIDLERARMLLALHREAEAYDAYESAAQAGLRRPYEQALAALALDRTERAVELLGAAVSTGGEDAAAAQARLAALAPAKP
ncbi:MAG: hypothetical protein KBD01_01255 [Acidobacteria bacterium]|nr:hypothetical protein [Acidobacteriota bacterium]